MPNLKRLSLLVPTLAALTAFALGESQAFAGWQAKLKMRAAFGGPGGNPGEARDTSGRAVGSGSKMRMDVNTPQGPTSIITDSKSHEAVALMHSSKMAMKLDFSKSGYQIPDCDLERGDACLASIGYKKVGPDSQLGQPCTLFEYKQSVKGTPVHTKLWRAVAKSEAPFVRFANLNAQNQEISYVELTEVKPASPLPGMFTAPSSYSALDMGKLMEGLGGPGGAGKLLDMLKKK